MQLLQKLGGLFFNHLVELAALNASLRVCNRVLRVVDLFRTNVPACDDSSATVDIA